jgi:hypothetical protein
MGACKECGCKDGDRGPIGPAGLKGDTGESGLTGNQGVQGPQGIEGIQGIQGIQGETGIQGAPGNSIGGTAGATGPQGLQGIPGIQGDPGVDGTDGVNGKNGQGRITYTVNTESGNGTDIAVLNEGIFMKNTGGVRTIEIPSGSIIGDVVRVVGTSFGTGGWRISATGSDTIQMTSQNPSLNITQPGGFITPATTNYRDVITIVSDGTGKWIVMDAIFANGNIPLFN